MRNVFLFLPILGLFWACGPQEDTKPEVVKTDEVISNTTDEILTDEEAIADVRKFYAETTAKLAAGSLKKDSLAYSCEASMQEGQLTFYANAGGVVLVENSYGRGDHFGQTDHWYFKDGKLAFLFEEAGSWQFGGPMKEDEAGNQMPGTVDEITENRYYFNNGELVKHLAKSYKLESWKEALNPDTVSNETMPHNGETPESYKFISAVMVTRVVDCGLLE